MVTITQRMTKLREVLAVRIGSGAAILPKDVKKIHMSFSTRFEGGHMGAKKFWRIMLPRLKYRNPAIPMTVYREANPKLPSTLSIHFAASSTPAATPDPSSASPVAGEESSPAGTTIPTGSTSGETPTSDHKPTKNVVSIDLRNKTHGQIWEEVRKATNATDVPPSPAELEELEKLAVKKTQSEESKKLAAEKKRVKKQEEMAIQQAKGELAEVD